MGWFPVTVYRNPKCGVSRNVSAPIRAAGYKSEVVECLKAGWTRAQPERLLTAILPVRAICRAKREPRRPTSHPDASDDAILDATPAHRGHAEKRETAPAVGDRAAPSGA